MTLRETPTYPPLNCPRCGDQVDLLEQLGTEIDPNTIDVLWRWHDDLHPGSGPYTPNDPGESWAGATTQADTLTITDFTVGKREVICGDCHLIHRPGICDG
jgi:hypothetical protein